MSQDDTMNTDQPTRYEHIQAVKKAHEKDLMRKENVVGVGIGLRQQGGERTNDMVLVVMVRKKVPRSQLSPDDVIPAEIEGVPVDVQVVGNIKAQT